MDNDFFQNRIIQDVVLNPNNDEVGVVIFTQGYTPESKDITVSLHQLIKKDYRCYTPYYKLEEFNFSNYELANKFITQIPTMSALEMIMMLRLPDNFNSYI
jgi:hypothetical protein